MTGHTVSKVQQAGIYEKAGLETLHQALIIALENKS